MNLSLLFISILAGFLLGVISGLVPGIHTNTFAFMLAAFAPWLLESGLSPLCIAATIVSSSLTHTFVNIIPSVFLGAPEADTSLAVLPGHQLLLDGFGAEAVRLSALGSAGAVLVSLVLMLPLSASFAVMYPLVNRYMGWILLVVVLVLIYTEKGEMIEGQGSLFRFKYRAFAALLFLLSGMLGLVAFESQTLMKPVISIGEPSILMPLFSGLFGASMLVISMMNDTVIPAQLSSRLVLSRRRIVRGTIIGSAAGAFVAWLPGITGAVATVLARIGVKEDYADENSGREFIVSISGVNTANAIFGLIALYVIGKTRSGAMVAVADILGGAHLDLDTLVLLLIIVVGVSIAAYFVTIFLGDRILTIVTRINYRMLCIVILTGLTGMVFLFSGWFGLVVFGMGIPVGMLAPYLKVRRSHAMGVLLLPLLAFYL
ncbi:MAG: tripartite tricarboxylate transporter permease [Methanosarcinales archaeon]|nr:tripartite tricarboxylate transporter permease [ANME-2 cluster archaeon]MDW7776049.1 tripartite tricarboxylate transporter permease [Methanosarcinales archaeon]